jgi:hypothetical protein
MSTRNVDASSKYKLLSSYIGGSKKELKKSRAKSIEDALTSTVKKVPGGEYLMNIKLYVVNGKYYAVEGDVWGINNEEASYRGFKIADKVLWKKGSKFKNAVIQAFKDEKTCLIKVDGEEKIIETVYDNISKVQ